MLNRREFVAATLATGVVLPSLHTPAFSKASFAIGKATVDIVSDGHLELPTSMVLGRVPEADRAAFLTANNLADDERRFQVQSNECAKLAVCRRRKRLAKCVHTEVGRE